MKRMACFVTAMAMAASLLAGCSTSNQQTAEETTAAQTEAAAGGSEEAQDTGEGEAEAAETEAEGAGDEAATSGEEYMVKPRQITDRKVKLGLIPVAMNTAYTMTINGAKKQIAENGDQIELIVQAPSSNASTITEQGNIMETMIQQGVDARPQSPMNPCCPT